MKHSFSTLRSEEYRSEILETKQADFFGPYRDAGNSPEAMARAKKSLEALQWEHRNA